MSRLPTNSRLRPVSTSTAYTTARLVVESAIPAISAWRRFHEGEVGEQPDHDERRTEGDEPDRAGGLPLAAQLRDVDLRSGEEREQDSGERAEEAQPARNVDVQRIADDHAGEELDQRDRDPDLDRHHRRDQDRRGEHCGNCYVAHLYLLLDGLRG